MNIRPCRNCPHGAYPCEIRGAVRANLKPIKPRLSLINFRCSRRDEGYVLGARVTFRLSVYAEDEEDESRKDSIRTYPGKGTIIRVAPLNGEHLVLFDKGSDPDWEGDAGRLHANRLKLTGEVIELCSCGYPVDYPETWYGELFGCSSELHKAINRSKMSSIHPKDKDVAPF